MELKETILRKEQETIINTFEDLIDEEQKEREKLFLKKKGLNKSNLYIQHKKIKEITS